MGVAHPRTGPRVIQKGEINTLYMDIYDRDTQAQATASAATVSIWLGDKQIVTDAAASSLGPPAYYTLPAATTSSETLSERVREVWTLTVSGTEHTVTVGGYLVLYPFVPPFTENDLINRHRSLAKGFHRDARKSEQPLSDRLDVEIVVLTLRHLEGVTHDADPVCHSAPTTRLEFQIPRGEGVGVAVGVGIGDVGSKLLQLLSCDHGNGKVRAVGPALLVILGRLTACAADVADSWNVDTTAHVYSFPCGIILSPMVKKGTESLSFLSA